MLAGLLLTAAKMNILSDESMLEFTRSLQASTKPAFVMYMPAGCQTDTCEKMLIFWKLAGNEMPNFVWLVDCSATSTQVLPPDSTSVHHPAQLH